MKTELIDTTIQTPLGQWPAITKLNNEAISQEFDLIRSDDYKMVLDISSNELTCRQGKFVNLNVNQLNILEGATNLNIRDYVTRIINDSSYVTTLATQSALLEQAVLKANGTTPGSYPDIKVNIPTTYGASLSVSEEYDMSSFFSITPKGNIPGLQTEDLYRVRLFRVIDSLKIPLSVGTIVTGGKLRNMVYHDHIMLQNNVKKVERAYVAVVNSPDKSSLLQYGAADTVILAN